MQVLWLGNKNRQIRIGFCPGWTQDDSNPGNASGCCHLHGLQIWPKETLRWLTGFPHAPPWLRLIAMLA
jgi:hypothetical protein